MPDRKGMMSSIVRSAQLHPWRTLERCALILLALHLASGRACRHLTAGSALCPAGQRSCCCALEEPGPLAVLSAEGVSPAPLPTMSLADRKQGETAEHHDFRGDIFRFPMGDGIILNLMKTKAGTLRSGDLHNCTQFDVILEGRAKLHTFDTVTRTETAVVYGRNDFIKIPARVPHLFEFLEDNYMVEWWDCDFRAWYFRPYRDRISAAFAKSQADAGLQANSKAVASKAAAAGVQDKQQAKQQADKGAASASAGATVAAQTKQQAAEEASRAAAARQRDRRNTAGQGGSDNTASDDGKAAGKASAGGGIQGGRVRDPVADATDLDGPQAVAAAAASHKAGGHAAGDGAKAAETGGSAKVGKSGGGKAAAASASAGAKSSGSNSDAAAAAPKSGLQLEAARKAEAVLPAAEALEQQQQQQQQQQQAVEDVRSGDDGAVAVGDSGAAKAGAHQSDAAAAQELPAGAAGAGKAAAAAGAGAQQQQQEQQQQLEVQPGKLGQLRNDGIAAGKQAAQQEAAVAGAAQGGGAAADAGAAAAADDYTEE